MDWLDNQIIQFIQIRFSEKAVFRSFHCFGWFSLIRAENRSPFVFFRFLTLLGKFWKFLRASLNDMDWLENQIIRFI